MAKFWVVTPLMTVDGLVAPGESVDLKAKDSKELLALGAISKEAPATPAAESPAPGSATDAGKLNDVLTSLSAQGQGQADGAQSTGDNNAAATVNAEAASANTGTGEPSSTEPAQAAQAPTGSAA